MNTYKEYLLLVFAILLTREVLSSLESEYANSAYLDEDENYQLYWKVNEEEKSVYFATKVKTLGWVGFGISAGKGNMAASDIMMGWVKDGKGYVQDRYADAKALPSLDKQQDFIMDGASEEGGYTTLKFHRKINTCDKRDRVIEPGTTRVVWAYNPEDPTNPTDGFNMHTARLSRSLLLLNAKSKRTELPQNLDYFDLRLNITIPSNDTTYMCMSYEFPQMAEKQHIVKFEPVITRANLGRVHHILVYSCKHDFPRSNLSVLADCYGDRNMAPAIIDCAGGSVIAAWGIGGNAFFYPEHVGFPIGAGHGPKFVVMEVHYDNPKEESGHKDNSGLRFYYTDKLRTFDAGVLWAGWQPWWAMVIPPQQHSWTSIGYCSGNCTRMAFVNSTLKKGGIKVFATFLHTHLQGQRIWTRHVRNGVELPEIARDDNYDFNYQEFQIAREETHILPGDDIIQMCNYQTMDKKKAVYGGLSTKEEMCMSFMLYYPKMELSKCLSTNNAIYALGKRYGGVRNITWTSEQINLYREMLDNNTEVGMTCRDNADRGYPIRRVPKPVITTKLKAQPDPCKAGIHSSASAAIKNTLMIFSAAILTLLAQP